MANVITEQGDLGLGLYDCDDAIYNEATKEDNKTSWSPKRCNSSNCDCNGENCSCKKGDTEF